MATNIQRIQAIANALINGTATNEQLNRLGVALAIHGAAYPEYIAADVAGKAQITIREFRLLILSVIKTAEIQGAVHQTIQDSSAVVENDFMNLP